MSKPSRTLGRTNTYSQDEENNFQLPRIDNKKPLANSNSESYNFTNNKKSSSGRDRDSILGTVTKDSLSNLNQNDKALIEELAKKLDDQKRELDQKNQTLMAVQRNFEGLSSLLKKEKDLGSDNKKKVMTLTEENSKLAEENRMLVRRVDDMIERLKKFEHESDANAKEKKKMHQSLEEYDLLKNRIQELQGQLDKKKKEVNDLEARNKTILGQVDKFKALVMGHEDEKQKFSLQLRDARNELLISQTENDRLHKLIVEYKVRLSDFDGLKEEYKYVLNQKNDNEKENKELVREVTALRNEITVLRDRNKKLEDGVQNQNLQLKFGTEKEESLRTENENLKKALQERESETTRASSKFEELEALLKKESQYNAKYKTVIEKYDFMSRDGGEVVLIKEHELDKMKAELADLKGKITDYEELKKKFDKLTKDVKRKDDMLEQALVDYQYQMERGTKLADRVKVLEEENKRYISHNQKMQTALDFKNESEKMKDGKLNDEIETLRKKLDSNISNLGDLNDKHRNIAAEKDSLSKQIENLRREVETKSSEIEALKKAAANSEAQNEKRALQARKEIENLQEAIKNSQGTADKNVAALKKEVGDLKSQNQKKDEEISELQSTIKNISQGGESSQKQIQSLELKIKDLRSTIEMRESQVESLKKTSLAITAELNEKTKELDQAAPKLKELQEKIKLLTEKNDNLTNKNNEINTALKDASTELIAARLRLKQAESSVEQLEGNYKDVLRKLAAFDEEKFKEKTAKLEDREKHFNKIIAKLDHAQSSLLISLSCCECMDYLKSPVTVLPCAHNYCAKCVPKGSFCKECGGEKTEIEHTFKNKILEEVIAKVSYNQVTLESLKPSKE